MAQYIITVVRKLPYERFIEAENLEAAETEAARVHIFFDPDEWQEADFPGADIESVDVGLYNE